ncbi:MAG: glycerate kinase [Armatimonadetes bacterium]|nr:glycerate kinase [Armatimonadota bacterium]
MVILVAPDSFKGSLTAEQAAQTIAEGVLRVLPDAEIDLLPIADGGEGTTDALLRAAGGERQEIRVTGPLGEPVESFYGRLDGGRTAVMEAAAACGLTQVPTHRRDPRVTTSRGLGELMVAALKDRPERIILGIGGSATNDGGSGMLRALGAKFLDARGDPLSEGGAALSRLARIDMSGWSWPEDGLEILVASDVTNPLCGKNGASAVFGPQKGASPEVVAELDRALERFAQVSAQTLGRDLADAPGAGAAGGIGYALLAFLGAKLRPGVEIVLEATRFEERAARADLVVTGEGRLDTQTGMGKAVLGVAQAGQRAGTPVIALAGSLSGDLSALKDEGLCAAMSIATGPSRLEEMMEDGRELLTAAAERAMQFLQVGAAIRKDSS